MTEYNNYSSISDELVDLDENANVKDTSRKLHQGNWTIYFITGLISSSVVFTPLPFNTPLMEARQTQPFGPCMKIHLFASAIISFACLWNVFHTPSHGDMYKNVHRWVGRIGLIASLFGAVFGFFVAWVERKIPSGQAIGLTILGIGQIYWTIMSYRTIRKIKDLVGDDPSSEEYQEKEKEIIGNHKMAVLNLWVFCLTPAWIRFPQIFGASANSPLLFLPFLIASPFFSGAKSALDRGKFW